MTVVCQNSASRAKTKARDVIPGWPRGRSTEIRTRWDSDWLWVFNRPLYDNSDRVLDKERNRVYHLHQQTMEDTFLASTDYNRRMAPDPAA